MSEPVTAGQMRRVAAASLVGTMVERYDFFIYGLAAALALGKLFFPQLDPTARTLSAFAAFAIGFLAGPIGGVIFGHLGDRIGHEHGPVLVAGVLPTYAQIAIAAPVLLVLARFVQGIAVGGEWGGAVLLGVERAPVNRKALYGSFAQVGSPLGLLLSAAAFAGLKAMPAGALHAWGWWIRFLVSAVLIVIGQLIRSRVEKSPGLAERGRPARLPLANVLSEHRVAVLLGTGAGGCPWSRWARWSAPRWRFRCSCWPRPGWSGCSGWA